MRFSCSWPEAAPFSEGSIMRQSVTPLLVTLLLGSIWAEGQTNPSSSPVFVTGTNFVQVPVIVQRSGKHVAGLKKEDFVVRQDGKPQPIASFEEFRGGEPSRPILAHRPEHFGNKPQQIPQQITIIAMDMVNTPNIDRAYFLQE